MDACVGYCDVYEHANDVGEDVGGDGYIGQ